MDQWKVTLAWHYHSSCKLVALKLHNSCSYIIVTKLNELHMYTISHTMNCICWNSCDLFDSIHNHKKSIKL
jgi:hypothetical protein